MIRIETDSYTIEVARHKLSQIEALLKYEGLDLKPKLRECSWEGRRTIFCAIRSTHTAGKYLKMLESL